MRDAKRVQLPVFIFQSIGKFWDGKTRISNCLREGIRYRRIVISTEGLDNDLSLVFLLDGSSIATDTTVDVPGDTWTTLYVGDGSTGSNQINGIVKDIKVFNSRLTEAEVAAQ